MICSTCGREKRIVIRCNRCTREVCLFCFSSQLGLCFDCITEEYNEKYANQIESYKLTYSVGVKSGA